MNAHNEQQGFTAADMADQAATAFERGRESVLAEQAAAAQEAVAYLDIGAGGYLDIGSDLPEEQLLALPNGRHALGIIGTYGIDGYVSAPVTAAPVDGRDVRSAITGLEGSVAVGSDGEWVSVRRAARDAAVMALRNVSLDCAHIYAAYSEAKAATPAAPVIDLRRFIPMLDRAEATAPSFAVRQEIAELRALIDASPKVGSEARALLDALVSLVAVARRYLPDYDEHPEVQKADDAIDAARRRRLE